MKRSVSTKLNIKHNTTASELRLALQSIPSDAIVGIYQMEGDRPWESSTQEITFDWIEEIQSP